MNNLHNNAPHRKCLRKKTTACVSLFVFFTIRRVTFPYSIENDANTTSQAPTTHYTNTWVKLTIVTHLSFSERIAMIDNLSFIYLFLFYFIFSGKNPVYRDRTRVPTCQKVTRLLLSYRATGCICHTININSLLPCTDAGRTETCVTPTCVAPTHGHVDASRCLYFLRTSSVVGRALPDFFFFFFFSVRQTTSGNGHRVK